MSFGHNLKLVQERVFEILHSYGRDSGTVKKHLAEYIGEDLKSANRLLSQLVEENLLLRACYGKHMYYFPPGHFHRLMKGEEGPPPAAVWTKCRFFFPKDQFASCAEAEAFFETDEHVREVQIAWPDDTPAAYGFCIINATATGLVGKRNGTVPINGMHVMVDGLGLYD